MRVSNIMRQPAIVVFTTVKTAKRAVCMYLVHVDMSFDYETIPVSPQWVFGIIFLLYSGCGGFCHNKSFKHYCGVHAVGIRL